MNKDTQLSLKEARDLRIDKEMRRLKKLFGDIPKDRLDSAQSLIRNAAFMTITLEDLQEAIIENGAICEYQNGANQWGTKKSPEVEIYNTMVKNHMSLIKQLCDLIPEDKPKAENDELMAFIKSVKR
jgi:hypothetical protein